MSLNGGSLYFNSSTLNGSDAFNVDNIDGLGDYFKRDNSNPLTADLVSDFEFKTSVSPSSTDSLTNKNYVDTQIATRARADKFNSFSFTNPIDQGSYICWSNPAFNDGKTYITCSRGLAPVGGFVFRIHDTVTNQIVWQKELTDYVLHTELATALSDYLLVSTFNTEKNALVTAINSKLDASVIASYSTTQQVYDYVASVLNSYYTKNQIDNFGFLNTASVNNLISSALNAYYSKTQIDNFGFLNTASTNNLITSALDAYYSKTQIDNFGFLNGNQVNTAISNILSSYSTVSGTDQQIINALANYVTQTLLTQTLNNYVTSSYLASNYSTTSSNNATFKTISSFNSDISNYYNKNQSDSLYLPSSTKIIPYTDTGNPDYQFKVVNKAFEYGSQTYEIQITDNNSITTSLTFGAGLINTAGTFNGVSNQKFGWLSSISSDLQTQLNNKANTSALSSYVLSSTLLNYTNTNDLNTILESYSTISYLNSRLNDYVPSSGYNSFNPANYYTKTECNSNFIPAVYDSGFLSINKKAPFGGAEQTRIYVKDVLALYAWTDGTYYGIEIPVQFFNFQGQINNVTKDELNFLSGVSSNVQSQINNKFDKSGGTITGDVHCSSNLTVDGGISCNNLQIYQSGNNRVAILMNGVLTESTTEYGKLAHLNNVSSDIQTQFNNITTSINNMYTSQTIASATVNKLTLKNAVGGAYNATLILGNDSGQNYNFIESCTTKANQLPLPLCINPTSNAETVFYGNIVLPSGKEFKASDANNSAGRFWIHSNGNVGIGCDDTPVDGPPQFPFDCRGLANFNDIRTLIHYYYPASGSQHWASYSWNGSFVISSRNSDFSYASSSFAITSSNQVQINEAPAREMLNIKGGMNLESTSGWNSSNSIRFIQNYDGGWGQWNITPQLDNSSSIGQLGFRLNISGQPLSNYSDVITLHDNSSNQKCLAICKPNGSDPDGYSYGLDCWRPAQFRDNVYVKNMYVKNGTASGLITSYSGDIYNGQATFTIIDESAGKLKMSLGMGSYENTFYGDNKIASGGSIKFDNTTNNYRWQITATGGYLNFLRWDNIQYAFKMQLSSDGEWIQYSDKNLKENIETIDPVKSLQKINNINVYAYNYKDSIDKSKKCIGVIAQEVKEVNKHCVREMKNDGEEKGYYALSYQDLSLHTMNGLKALTNFVGEIEDKVIALESENEKLKNENETIKAQNNKLSSQVKEMNDKLNELVDVINNHTEVIQDLVTYINNLKK